MREYSVKGDLVLSYLVLKETIIIICNCMKRKTLQTKYNYPEFYFSVYKFTFTLQVTLKRDDTLSSCWFYLLQFYAKDTTPNSAPTDKNKSLHNLTKYCKTTCDTKNYNTSLYSH